MEGVGYIRLGGHRMWPWSSEVDGPRPWGRPGSERSGRGGTGLRPMRMVSCNAESAGGQPQACISHRNLSANNKSPGTCAKRAVTRALPAYWEKTQLNCFLDPGDKRQESRSTAPLQRASLPGTSLVQAGILETRTIVGPRPCLGEKYHSIVPMYVVSLSLVSSPHADRTGWGPFGPGGWERAEREEAEAIRPLEMALGG